MTTTVDRALLNEIVGSRIAELRKKRGLTQKQLADSFNINSNTLAHYEQGVTLPSADMLVLLADYFNVNVDYLLGRCKSITTYNKLNDTLFQRMIYSDLIDKARNLSKDSKRYLYHTIHILSENDESHKGRRG